MSGEQSYDERLNAKLTQLCQELAEETGTPPMGALLLVEWPTTNGGVAISLPANLERKSLMQVVDSIGRKAGIAITRIKAQINVVRKSDEH